MTIVSTLVLVTGCADRRYMETGQAGFTNAAVDSEPLASRLDRGGWLVSSRSQVWKVFEDRANRPERHIGYVVGSDYRQMRGGPQFTMYKVTTLDRDDQIGHVDQMGRAIRYEPQRDGGFTEVPVGSSTREENIAAIFDTTRRVRLVETSQRRLAFESLDLDGDGLLGPNETAPYGDRILRADANGDGIIDYQEFDSLDVL